MLEKTTEGNKLFEEAEYIRKATRIDILEDLIRRRHEAAPRIDEHTEMMISRYQGELGFLSDGV